MNIFVKILCAVSAMTFLVFGCMRPAERTGQEESSPKPQATQTNPLDLPEDLTIVPSKYPLRPDSVNFSANYALKGRPGAPRDSSLSAYESYRIQIFQSKVYGPAVKALSVAQELFDQRVWLDYEVPYYKVRVGDFPARESAEAYLPSVRQAGYDAAWVVRVNVNVETLETGFRNELPVTLDSSGTPKVLPGQVNDTSGHQNH